LSQFDVVFASVDSKGKRGDEFILEPEHDGIASNQVNAAKVFERVTEGRIAETISGSLIYDLGEC
jgi:hypothetical protein